MKKNPLLSQIKIIKKVQWNEESIKLLLSFLIERKAEVTQLMYTKFHNLIYEHILDYMKNLI
jgi:hypothetical protein